MLVIIVILNSFCNMFILSYFSTSLNYENFYFNKII